MVIQIGSTILKGVLKCGIAILAASVAAALSKKTVNETTEDFYQCYNSGKNAWQKYSKTSTSEQDPAEYA
jgi:hypothetical protein